MTVRPALLRTLLVVVVLALLMSIGENVITGYRLSQRIGELPQPEHFPKEDGGGKQLTLGTSDFLLILNTQCDQLALTLTQYETAPLSDKANRYALTLEGSYEQITALVNWLEAQTYVQEIQGFDLQGQDKRVKIEKSNTTCELSMVINAP